MNQGKIEIHGGGHSIPGMTKRWLIGDITPFEFREQIYAGVGFDVIKAAVQSRYGEPHNIGGSQYINCAIVNRRLVIL